MNLKDYITRFIKRKFTIIPDEEKFHGLTMNERKITTYAQVLDLIDELKVYIKGLSSVTVHSKDTLKLLMATNNEGGKMICISLQSLCISTEREDGSDVPTLSRSFTGDISFVTAITDVINARFCDLNKSSSCDKVYKKDLRNATKSGCSKCLSHIRGKNFSKRQQAIAKAEEERDRQLMRAGSHFQEHVTHQVQRSANNQPYNARLVESHFYFAVLYSVCCLASTINVNAAKLNS